MFQYDRVREWQSGRVVVWQCCSVTVRQCGSVAVYGSGSDSERFLQCVLDGARGCGKSRAKARRRPAVGGALAHGGNDEVILAATKRRK